MGPTLPKKGQSLTLFLVLGIVMLVAFGMVFYLKGTLNKTAVVPAEQLSLSIAKTSLENQVDLCIQQKVREAIDYYGALQDAEAEVKAYVEREVPRCIDLAFYEEQGISIEQEEFTASVLISPNAVVVDALYPLVLFDDTGSSELDKFGFSITKVVSKKLKTNAQGILLEEVTIVTDDGEVQLYLPEGTKVIGPGGRLVDEITIELKDKTEGGFSNSLLPGEVLYDIGPDGTTFSPPVTLIIGYELDQLHGQEMALSIVYFDESIQFWRSLDSVVDPINQYVSAKIYHLTDYGISEGCTYPAPAKMDSKIIYLESCYRPCGLGAATDPEDWDGCWKTRDYEGSDDQVYATPDMIDVLLRGVDDAIYATEEHITSLGLDTPNEGETRCGEPLPITSTSEGFEQVGTSGGVSVGEAIVAVRCSDKDDCDAQKEIVNEQFGFTDEDWDDEGQPGIPNDRCYDEENIQDWDKDDQYENICVCVKQNGDRCDTWDNEFKTKGPGAGKSWQEDCTGKNQKESQDYYDENYAVLDSFSWLLSRYGDDLIMNKDGIIDGPKDKDGAENGEQWEGGCGCTVKVADVEVGKEENPEYPLFSDEEFIPVYEKQIVGITLVEMRENPADEDTSKFGEVASPNYQCPWRAALGWRRGHRVLYI